MSLPGLFILLLVTAGSSLAAAVQDEPAKAAGNHSHQQALLEAGKRIYLHGQLHDGGDIRARVRGDVALQGSQYACANCHRRSGIGSSEGGDLVPPVIGSALFSPRVSGLHDLYAAGSMRHETRPAYTTDSLERALREGRDPAGRELSPLMPRFELSDRDIIALSTYLASLTVDIPPGIGDEEIHFATITTPGNHEARTAMLDVLNAFFLTKNAGTRNETRRAQHAPYHKEWMYGAYRRWKLHVWDLNGDEQGWPAQLENHYAAQPVFAVLGGVGGGNWQPIHGFCEERELPCLMPNIPLPPEDAEQDFYSVYLSRGVALEAQALGGILAGAQQTAQTAIQVLRNTPEAKAAAATLRRTLAAANAPVILRDIVLDERTTLAAGFWSALAAEHKDATWVLWLNDEDLMTLEKSDVGRDGAIYLSATLLKEISTLQQHPLHRHFTLLSPYRPPENANNTRRFLAWARIRNLPVSNLHIQSSTFLAATLAGESLMHMRGNFSREYFIERIEHMLDNMINPSLYPRLSLAPGQRFAAKGCYVWEMGKTFDTARWVVP